MLYENTLADDDRVKYRIYRKPKPRPTFGSARQIGRVYTYGMIEGYRRGVVYTRVEYRR